MKKHPNIVPLSMLRGNTDKTVLADSAMAASLGITTRDLRQATIAIIDDEPIIVEIVQSYLEEWGYEHFLTVTDSTRAIQIIEDQQPDIILLDFSMPEIDGLQILAQIRNNELLRHLPTVMLTADTNEDMRVSALSAGATDFLTKPVNASELALRVQNILSVKLHNDRLTYYDALTNLPNRTLFLEKLDWELNRMRRYDSKGAVVHLDLDRFKRINDNLGYEAGDAILKAVSQRLGNKVRTTDAICRSENVARGTSLSRMGGDEFTLILPEINRTSDVLKVINRVLETMQTPFKVANQDITISASIGIAIFPDDGDDTETLLKHAEQAMYHCKQQRRNDFEFYSVKMNSESQAHLSLEHSLRLAVEREEFELVYQPKVDVNCDCILGVETLLRWNHPEQGVISPLDFIPLAEESGLIIPIGKWVLENACRQAMAWQAQGLNAINMAVNVSIRQFHDINFLDDLSCVLKDTGLDPGKLTLELTENMLMENMEENLKTLARIKAMGVKLSIDDFGTGYSSLSYLHRFPLDELKIDRSFIKVIESKDDKAPIASAVVAMAQSLGLTTVAEGVEIKEQLDFLKELGCYSYQGYLFSKPISADEFARLLEGNCKDE